MALYQNTRRPDGSRFETDTPMSLTEKIAWCAPMACLTGYAVSVMMGWLPNIVSWVMS